MKNTGGLIQPRNVCRERGDFHCRVMEEEKFAVVSLLDNERENEENFLFFLFFLFPLMWVFLEDKNYGKINVKVSYLIIE